MKLEVSLNPFEDLGYFRARMDQAIQADMLSYHLLSFQEQLASTLPEPAQDQLTWIPLQAPKFRLSDTVFRKALC
jgi:hypothetical protein